MLTIIKWANKLFKLPFLRELDGHKEVLGAVLILFTAIDGALLQAIALLPDVPVLVNIESFLSTAVEFLGKLGEVLGVPVFAVGALGRRAKEKLKA